MPQGEDTTHHFSRHNTSGREGAMHVLDGKAVCCILCLCAQVELVWLGLRAQLCCADNLKRTGKCTRSDTHGPGTRLRYYPTTLVLD
jgi:hypothetical protein